VPDDLFTAPANPLTLTITTADDHAAAVAIGPDGGTISTTDAVGTTYTLTIPADSLPLPITITMTPIASETGFPVDGTPEHTLGVAFTPDGLTLAQTATLTITPVAPIDVPMAVLDADGDGGDVGFHYFDHDAAGVQIPIDHFSNYTAEYPVDLPQIRAQALYLQAELEKRLASETAQILGFQRQSQLYPGLPSFGTPLSLAERTLADFKNRVLARRLALAPRGCQESEEAIAAFAAYERTRQLLGVGDDPEFGLVGVTFLVPPTLMDLAIRLCFREAFAFCVKSGDFPGLEVYMFAMFQRNRNMLGLEPTDDQRQLALGYLQRCGHWRLTIEASATSDDQILGQKDTIETKTELDLAWHEGSGDFGILKSTIDSSGSDDPSSGDIEATKLEGVDDTCAPVTKTNATTDQKASASIDELQFDRYEGPTETGEAIPPQPSLLKLHVHFGMLGYDLNWCQIPQQHSDENFWWAGILLGAPFDYAALATGVDVVVTDGWTFSIQPFKATQTQAGTVKPDPAAMTGTDATVTLTLEHTPQP
jgi:hypothetical protein